jgi:hypothetical protein
MCTHTPTVSLGGQGARLRFDPCHLRKSKVSKPATFWFLFEIFASDISQKFANKRLDTVSD